METDYIFMLIIILSNLEISFSYVHNIYNVFTQLVIEYNKKVLLSGKNCTCNDKK